MGVAVVDPRAVGTSSGVGCGERQARVEAYARCASYEVVASRQRHVWSLGHVVMVCGTT